MSGEPREAPDNPGMIAPPPLIYCGITARANALTAVLLPPLVLAVMRRGVIEREESYPERKFGDEYLRCKGRVRTWI